MNIRITLLIPVLLVFSTIAASFMLFVETKRVAVHTIRADALRHLKLDITRLQNILYNLLTEREGKLDEARLNLSVTAMDSDLQRLLLVDEYGSVLLANRYLLEGRPAEQVAGYDAKRAFAVKTSNKPQVYFDPYNRAILRGYYPVVLKLQSEAGLPIKKTGVLYAEFSIATHLAQSYRQAGKQSLGFGVLMLGAALLVALLLHLLISRRLQWLTDASRQLASGDLDTRVQLGGSDELTLVGQAFNDMAERIKEDIRKRETAEKQLREVNDSLEQHVLQRTKELEQKKQELLDSQAMTFHANKLTALGEMASGIAHEINSPLQTISLLTYKIKLSSTQMDCEAVNDASHKIDNAVQKVSDIVESLRKMSRYSSDDPFEKVTLREIVDDVTGITLERYKLNGIHLEVVFHNNCIHSRVKCQRLRIAQVLVNLLNNAYDAVLSMEQRLILLELFDLEDMIEFAVTDTGPGVSAENAAKVFEPMFTTKDVGKGTGLGLSISSEIVRQHQGRLFLDKTAKNTRFVLTLPK